MSKVNGSVPAKDHTLEVPAFDGNVDDFQDVTLIGGVGAEKIEIASPLAVMSRQQALIHAAHIVATADRSENFQEFRQILKAVLGT
jgi:hypothetical protein